MDRVLIATWIVIRITNQKMQYNKERHDCVHCSVIVCWSKNATHLISGIKLSSSRSRLSVYKGQYFSNYIAIHIIFAPCKRGNIVACLTCSLPLFTAAWSGTLLSLSLNSRMLCPCFFPSKTEKGFYIVLLSWRI